MDQDLSQAFLDVVEQAAVACAHTMGQGDRHLSDHVAVEAMRARLDHVPIDGRVVIGEGERDKAPMLYIGEPVGQAGRWGGGWITGHRYRRRSARGHQPVRHRGTQCHCRFGGGRARRPPTRTRHIHGQTGGGPAIEACGEPRCLGSR